MASFDVRNLQAAKRAAAARFEAVGQQLLAEAGVGEVEYRDVLAGFAFYRIAKIRVPHPTTRNRLYIFAHECGHIAIARRLGLAAVDRQPRHRQEFEAERWAHDALRRHGIAVPRKMTLRSKQYVARKIHQAIVRGAKVIDREAAAWCRDFWSLDTRMFFL